MPIFNFGKKGGGDPAPWDSTPAPPLTPPPGGPPTDDVLAMRQQGLSNNQIIQRLQQQGIPPNLIFDAMNQAEVKGSMEAMPAGGSMPPPENPMQFSPEGQYNSPQYPPNQQYPQGQQYPQQSFQQSYAPQGSTEERIEEIAEAIIDEKWNELVKNVNKIVEWKDRTEERIAQMEQAFTDLGKNFDALHQGVLGKIGEYDQNLVNLGSDIKAMEQVFQKILPTLTDNIQELSRITQDVKKKKGSQ